MRCVVTTPDTSQVTICDPTAEPSDGQIVICDPAAEPAEGQIVICPPECGPDIPDLTISGTVTPSVGSAYNAAGGKPPYTWSISCGSISLLGTITDLAGCCGTGSVTVTDQCGTAVSLQVKFPVGQWVLQGLEGSWTCVPTDFGYDSTEISGVAKTEKMYCCLPISALYDRPCEGSTVPCCNMCSLASMDSYFTSEFIYETIQRVGIKTYTWECL